MSVELCEWHSAVLLGVVVVPATAAPPLERRGVPVLGRDAAAVELCT